MTRMTVATMKTEARQMISRTKRQSISDLTLFTCGPKERKTRRDRQYQRRRQWRNGTARRCAPASKHLTARVQRTPSTSGDRSSSLTARGAKSHHSMATPSCSLRVTCAFTFARPSAGSGKLMMISINVFSRKSCSDFMSAPLKLKFFKRHSISDDDTAAQTGILTRTRLPHRCSILFSGSAMGELTGGVDDTERCAVQCAMTVHYRPFPPGQTRDQPPRHPLP